jgi:DivIVA domain-containing protein
MKRDQIVRSDFPTARRGYDPEAVDAHLRKVADSVESGGDASLASVAAEKVSGIVGAAEEKARELEADARREADELVSSARREADELLAGAREQARVQVERAQDSVASLVGQADQLSEKVGRMARDLAGSEDLSAEMPGPQPVPEPSPEPIPEPEPPAPEVDPTPVIVPEPTPEPMPEPTPDPVPEPIPDSPAPAATNGSEDEQAARLVAMKMALDGSSREEIAAHLTQNYRLVDGDELLDTVFAHAGK